MHVHISFPQLKLKLHDFKILNDRQYLIGISSCG